MSSDVLPDNDQLREQAMEEIKRESMGPTDMSQSLEPDSRGYIGDYHVNDLMEQYAEMRGNYTDSDMEKILADEENYSSGKNLPLKFDKKTRTWDPNVVDDQEIENTRYLGNAIRYGREVIAK